jgi:hypothetical protein
MPLSHEEALAWVEEALRASSQASRPKRLAEKPMVGCLAFLIGLGTLLLGCSILVATISGFRRPLRQLGLSTPAGTASILIAAGAFMAWLITKSGRVATHALEPPTEVATVRTCWNCDKGVPAEATTCPHCEKPQP